MPELQDLTRELREAHQRFEHAIDATAGSWEELREGEWSPREIVQHSMEVDLQFAAAIAGAAGLAPPAQQSFDLASAADAKAALPATQDAVADVVLKLEEGDLEKPSPVLSNVYGTLVLSAHHLNLHSLQMQGR